MPTADLLVDEAGLAAVEGEWDELAVACARPGSMPGLLMAWWRHMRPPDAAPRVVTVREGGRLVGLAPFLVHGGPRGRAALRLFGTPSLPQRAGILAAPGHEAAVWVQVARALGRSQPRPALVSLERVDANAAWPRAVARAWPGAGRGPPAARVPHPRPGRDHAGRELGRVDGRPQPQRPPRRAADREADREAARRRDRPRRRRRRARPGDRGLRLAARAALGRPLAALAPRGPGDAARRGREPAGVPAACASTPSRPRGASSPPCSCSPRAARRWPGTAPGSPTGARCGR